MRYRPDDDPAPLEIELLDVDGAEASEVSFGGRSARTGGRRRALVKVTAAAAALAVIVAIVSMVRDDDGGTAPATTEPGVPSTVGAVVPVPTIFDRSTTTTAVATTDVYDAPAVFATDPGWRVYLGTPSFMQSFDPTAGTLQDVDAPDDLYLVTPGSDGPAFLARDRGTEIVVPVGDGTGWTLGPDDSLRRVDLDDRTTLESVGLPVTPDSPQFGPVLLGTDAEGRPVVVLGDFRTYRVASDGSLTAFAEGAITTNITSGRYLSTDCRGGGICVDTLHAGESTVVVVDLEVEQLAFSAAGTHAVLFGSGPRGEVYRVVDLGDGATVFEWGDVDSSFTFYGFNTPLPGWSPDGRFFFVTVDGSLQAFDTTTNSVFRLLSDLPQGTVVRGVV